MYRSMLHIRIMRQITFRWPVYDIKVKSTASRVPGIIGMLLRYTSPAEMQYFLRPIHEELEYVPDYLRPHPVERTASMLSWLSFMPWSQVREGLRQAPFRHNDVDLQVTIANNLHLNWPEGCENVITYDQITSRERLPSSRHLCSHCECGGPWITEAFKENIMNVDNWKLRLGVAQSNQFPELRPVGL